MTFFRRAAVVLLPLALVAGMAGAAHGQLGVGRSGSSSLEFMDAAASMRELVTFGRCYARNSRNDSLALIATRPTSREEAEVYRRLFSGDSLMCLTAGTTMSAPLGYVRGAIAEGLFRAGQGVPPSHVLAAPTVAQVRNLSDAARCYAAGHREQVRALLAITPGTREEYDAVSALVSGILACTPPGARVQGSATLLRFRLVEGLLRLPPNSPAPPGS
ncbi:MAG TPA: hypothetical protein VMS43_14460 [Allosphingosinicella sp.]|nr:hypothetical protein [Allosphingosinicella sp.]